MPFFGGGSGDYHIVATNIKGGTLAAPAVIGDNNMALGNGALQLLANGDRNIAVGTNALSDVVNSPDNIGIGYAAGSGVVVGTENVFVGNNIYLPDDAEQSVIIGNNAGNNYGFYQSVVIGANALGKPDFGAIFNIVEIGYGSQAQLDDAVVIGARAFGSGITIGLESQSASSTSVSVGRSSNADLGGIAIGNAVAGQDAIAIGNGATAANNEISIGVGTETAVSAGVYNLADFITAGVANFWTTDYLAVGIDSNTANVNGAAVTADLVAWVDNGGITKAGIGIGKAENTTAAAGAVFYGGRSRGTIAAPAIVQNGDELTALYGVGYDGVDYATSAKISMEVDGAPGVNDMPGRIVFSVSPDGSQALAEALRISNNKTVSPAALLDISGASAGQIKFPAAQNPSADANTLDDYEEGTFTPIIVGLTAAGVGTYTAQTGTYTKVGRLVTVSLNVAWSAHTGTGIMTIQGLPFLPTNVAGCAIGLVSGAGAGVTGPMGRTNTAFSGINLANFAAGSTTNLNINATGNWYLTCSYEA